VEAKVTELRAYLAERATDGLIASSAQLDAAITFQLSFAEVEEKILQLGFCPARYQRNRQTISGAGQLALLQSCVAVIGCGGLGGYVVEELARLGVGRIIAVDPDVFEEHNLNRQILATWANLGTPKVTAASRRVNEINPAVSLVPVQTAFGAENGGKLLAGATVVVDALDNIKTRLELIGVCRELGTPLVHGAIAGWYGQVITQLPGEDITRYLTGAGVGAKGVETKLGNPSFTPATVASLQVAEVCKIIVGQGNSANGRMLLFDLLHMEFDEIRL
jgi:molybdopterin/thiamine biosynthesis adenylyltransferase